MKRMALVVVLICSTLLTGCIVVPARGHCYHGEGPYRAERG